MFVRNLLILITISIVSTHAWSEDLSYIDSNELHIELNARKTDLKRTQNRITDIQQRLLAQQHEVKNLREQIASIDTKLVQRTSMLYRLSKNGKSVQYLFTAGSATAFVKRMQTLKKLVTSQMDAKRDVSVQLEHGNDEIKRLKNDLHNAKQLGQQLTAIVDSLQKEQQQRQSANKTSSL